MSCNIVGEQTGAVFVQVYGLLKSAPAASYLLLLVLLQEQGVGTVAEFDARAWSC